MSRVFLAWRVGASGGRLEKGACSLGRWNVKPQETLFQERAWAQGRLGGFRETQGGEPGCWVSGTGEGSHACWTWAWNLPWSTPRRVWRSSRKCYLSRCTQGSGTVRWRSEHRTWGGPFSHSTKPCANAPEADVLSVLKIFCWTNERPFPEQASTLLLGCTRSQGYKGESTASALC